MLKGALIIGFVEVKRRRRCQVFKSPDQRATLHYHEPDGTCIKESYYNVAEAIHTGKERGFSHVYIGERIQANLMPVDQAMLRAALDGNGIFAKSGRH